MNFGKKLAIIGLIIFGVGVPLTAISMSSPLFDVPPGVQQSTTMDGIVVYPNEVKNIKYTFHGFNPVLASFEVNPQGMPYGIIVTNYEWSNEVLNIVDSGSAEYKIDYARAGTYDFDFTNLGDEELYITVKIKDAIYGESNNLQRQFIPIMIYIYYAVFFGGIAIGSVGAAIWRITK